MISFRNYVAIKHFSLAPYAVGTIYGRAAAAADCATLSLPPYERALCPSPAQQSRGPDWLDHAAASPIKNVTPPPGMHHVPLAANFSRRVFEQQPGRVATAIGRDAVKLFALQRVTSPGDTPIARWRFQRAFPLYPPYTTDVHGRLQFAQLSPAGKVTVIAKGRRFADQTAVNAGLAGFLRAYQLRGGYTPGPLFLFTAGRAGRQHRRAAPPGLPAAAGDRHCLPAGLPQCGRGAARVRRVRVQLAVPVAGPCYPAPGGGAGPHGDHRICGGPAPAHPGAAARPGPAAGLRAGGGPPRFAAPGAAREDRASAG